MTETMVGLLVVGWNVGGQVEMLRNGEDSSTYTPRSSEELAEQLESAFRDAELRGRLARAGQDQILEQFTPMRMVDGIEQYLSVVVESALAAAGA